MKFLKPLLFCLFAGFLSSCENTENNLTSSETPKEYVLRLANNMGKHTVAEGCEIEFYADTNGKLWLGRTIHGESRDGSDIKLSLGEPISFYWEKDSSTLWYVASSEIWKRSYTESGTSGNSIHDYSKDDLVQSLEKIEAPTVIRTLAEHHQDNKPLDSLPGLHLTNIFGEKQLGEITIECRLDTRGHIWMGHTKSSIGLDLSSNEQVYIYYNAEAKHLWTLLKDRATKQDLEGGSCSFTITTDSLKQQGASAKVIELAKELNPSL